MFRAFSHRSGLSVATAIGVLLVGAAFVTSTVLHAQQQFQLYVAALDDTTNTPVTDLTVNDLIMEEAGEPGRVVRLEPYRLPVKLTILIDNGNPRPSGGRNIAQEGLAHYRSGLRGLLEVLPADLEVGVIALAPNPRWLARPTTDRVELMRSVQLLTPDSFPARFSDALVEYAQRLDREIRSEQDQAPFMPILVSLGTAGLDGSQSRREDLVEMLERMVQHRVRTYFAMWSPGGEVEDIINEGSQVLVAKAAQEVTGGQYEALAISSRVATLMPEWGEQIAMTHRVGTNQYRVTLERPLGASGPLTQLSMFVNREGYYGVVTADGRVP